MTINDGYASNGQITKETPQNRLLSTKNWQEFTATNTEATYW